ncbi:MAG: mechanosensitive ion channel [Clostridia bacterium]|nr:mechanosensitive ion channel [Clostridia bacterium]
MKTILFTDIGGSAELLQELWDTVTSLNTKQWLIGIGIFLLLLVVSHFLVRLFAKRLDKSQRISRTLHGILVMFLRFLLILVSAMIAANAVGISVSAFFVVFLVFGTAIALAAQGVLNNIAGCIILLSGKLFEVDDYIETPSGSGTVKEINLLNTKLLSYEGHTIYIPNSVLYTTTVTNMTSYKKRRANLSFRVSAKYAPEDVRKAALAAAAAVPYVLDDPAPIVVVNGYTAGHVNYLLLVWGKADEYWPMRNGVNEQLYSAIKEAGMEMTDKEISFVVADQ